MAEPKTIVQVELIESMIYLVRGQRVMLDSDLAELYGVETKFLNRAVKRNQQRFPRDFVFQLSREETEILRCQNGTSKNVGESQSSQSFSGGRGGRRYLPYVFTEHGAIMAANVLSSERAVEASVQVVRAFIKLREMLVAHKDLARKLTELEKKYDKQFAVIFAAIRQLMDQPAKPKESIGFRIEKEKTT